MASKTRRIVGIELAGDSFRGVVLEKRDDNAQPLVRGYAIVEHPAGRPIRDTLQKLLSKLPGSCRDCAVAAWPQASVFRIIQAKPQSALLLQNRMRSNPAQVFGRTLEGYEFSCAPVVDWDGSSMDDIPHLACGAPISEIQELAETLKSLRRNLNLFQITPIAVTNAFCESHKDQIKSGPFLAVAFGRRRTSLIGGYKGTAAIIRTMDWGMNHLLEHLLAKGTIADASQFTGLTHETPAAAEEVRSALELITTEISRSSIFLESKFGVGMPPRIHLSGPISNHRFITGILAEELGVTCQQWNPLRECAASNVVLNDTKLLSDLCLLPAAAGVALQHLL